MALASVQCVAWGEEISPVGEHLLEDAASQVEEFGFGERGNGDPERLIDLLRVIKEQL